MSRIAAAHDQSLTTPRKTGCARFWVDRHFHDLEYLQSSDRQHSFGAHTHNTFVLGCVEQGGLAYRNRGQEGTVAPGQVLVINPGDLHDCRPGDAGASYRMLYPSDRLMTEAAADLGHEIALQPRFSKTTLDDPDLAAAIIQLHRRSESAPGNAPGNIFGRLALEEDMLSMLALLFSHHSDVTVANDRVAGDRALVRRACDFLAAHLERDVSLRELSAALDVSQFRLIREFRKVMGQTPHVYLINQRLEKAKRALAAGGELAPTAIDCGFWDQSHFHRWFKRAFAVTPKAYQAAYRA